MTNKPVLLATDMTARCDRPLDRALMLAKRWNTRLIIAHVIDSKDTKKSGLVPRECTKEIQAELPETDVDVQIIVDMGDIGETVLAISKRERCGLIVTGVAHYDGLSDIFMGSPVDYIIRNSEVPVLIVKRKPMKNYENILVATDFSNCSLKALNTAAEMFPEIPLHVVHSYHVPYSGWLKSDQVEQDVGSEEAKLMERFLAQTSISNETFSRLNASTEKGEMGSVLMNKIKETKAGLVVLGTHGRSGFHNAAIGSKARFILGWLKQDVLLVREKR